MGFTDQQESHSEFKRRVDHCKVGSRHKGMPRTSASRSRIWPS